MRMISESCFIFAYNKINIFSMDRLLTYYVILFFSAVNDFDARWITMSERRKTEIEKELLNFQFENWLVA